MLLFLTSTLPSTSACVRPASTITFWICTEPKLSSVNSRPLWTRTIFCVGVGPSARSNSSSAKPRSASPFARSRPCKYFPTGPDTSFGKNRPMSIAFTISTVVFALSGFSPNVAERSTSPGSLPPRISAFVLSM